MRRRTARGQRPGEALLLDQRREAIDRLAKVDRGAVQEDRLDGAACHYLLERPDLAAPLLRHVLQINPDNDAARALLDGL